MGLIDTDILKGYFLKDAGHNPTEVMWEYWAIETEIDSCPTVDAVEVVRCGECRYYRDSLGGYACENEFWNAEYLVLTEPDDFCSYGERKEND